jgi:hypothetical protein
LWRRPRPKWAVKPRRERGYYLRNLLRVSAIMVIIGWIYKYRPYYA